MASRIGDGRGGHGAPPGKAAAWLLADIALLAGGGTVAWLAACGAAHLPTMPLSLAWPVWLEQRLVICQG